METNRTLEIIRSEIERRLKKYATDVTMPLEALGKVILELKGILSFLSTLESEKPMEQDEDFRGELREWVELMVAASFPEQDGDFISEEDYRSVIKQTARHFAQWGAEHLIK